MGLNPTLNNTFFSNDIEYSGYESELFPNMEPLPEPKLTYYSRRYRIAPDKEQRNLLAHWSEGSNTVYNRSMDHLASNLKERYTPIRLISDTYKNYKDVDCPANVKQTAIADACTAHRTNRMKAKKTGVGFRISKRSGIYMRFQANNLRRGNLFIRKMGRLKYLKDKPTDEQKGGRIFMRYGRYYITVNYNRMTDEAERGLGVCAVTPECNEFVSIYSRAEQGQLGYDAIHKIGNLAYNIDDLLTEIEKRKSVGGRTKSLLKALDRNKRKVESARSELHYKIARYIVDRYNYIVIPQKGNLNFSGQFTEAVANNEAEMMADLSWYMFTQRLISTANFSGKVVITRDETDLTSQEIYRKVRDEYHN